MSLGITPLKTYSSIGTIHPSYTKVQQLSAKYYFPCINGFANHRIINALWYAIPFLLF